jgi:exosome complex component RRP42
MNNEMKNHLIKSLNEDIRIDKRKKSEWRDVEIETGIIKTAEGSARVKFGNSEVIAGIKLSVGEPYPDSPEEGALMVNTELLPLSDPEFETGPPRIDAIENARVIDRGIRESGAIDTKKLCIEKGEKVWIVSVDIAPINNDGNLIDIGGLAAVAALKDTKFPKLDKDNNVDYDEMSKKKLEIKETPIPVTVLKIGNNFIVDPKKDEEEFMDARLTVTFIKKGKMCAMQKGGDNALTEEDVIKMIDLAEEKYLELSKKL